jgi:TolB-like protein
MKSLFQSLKDRRVFQWAIGYAAGGWLVLEMFGFVAENFGWPAGVVRGATVVIGTGFLVALVLAWYHGAGGRQRASVVELVMIAMLLVLGGLTLLTIRRSQPETTRAATFDARQLDETVPSIAILPFANLSADSSNEFFSDGVTEEIIIHLTRLEGLTVISRASVMRYKGESVRLDEIARELGVTRIVEGSVRKSGDRVRITAQLVDPATGRSIWADDYDRELTDIFAIQSDVAEQVARALELQLSDADRARIERRPTSSLEAHDLYLRGREAWNRRTGSSMEASIGFFERAVSLDEEYAAAWAGLADAYAIVSSYTRVPAEDTHPLARQAAERALAIDSTLGEPYAALGMIGWGRRPADEVDGTFRRAIELNPGYATAHHWYAIFLASEGRLEEAMDQIRLAKAVDPLSRIIVAEVGWVHYFARDFEQAIEGYERAVDLDSGFAQAREFLWGVYEQTGRYAEAAKQAGLTVTLQGQPEGIGGRLTSELTEAYELGGEERYWETRLEWLERLGGGTSYLGSPTYTAGVYARTGDLESAFRQLNEAVDYSADFRAFIPVEPALDPLRDDPRYDAVVARLVASTSEVGTGQESAN